MKGRVGLYLLPNLTKVIEIDNITRPLRHFIGQHRRPTTLNAVDFAPQLNQPPAEMLLQKAARTCYERY